MSIFDYLAPKSTDEQERKLFSPTPYRKLTSALDASAGEVKAQYPDDSQTVDQFVRSLKEVCKARCRMVQSGDSQPVKASAQFCLSNDRMSAYACLLPPENDGNAIALEEFLREMNGQGICFGILREEIRRELDRGYLRIFPAARGALPQAGKEGKVIELFPRREKVRLEARDAGQVNFHQDIPLQPIRKGMAICRIQPPTEGTDGSDVTGQALACVQPDRVIVPQGENTAVSGDGKTLAAGVDGFLYTKDDQFCVQEQTIIDGNLERPAGTVKASGDLYISGNVDGGAVVEAVGDIVINGKLGEARVTSMGGTIRVQQGVYGTQDKTFLSAARQVQSPVVERADVSAGVGVIAETISNSTIHCDGTVYAATGSGTITGSLIWTGDSVLCLQIGGPAGDRSRFSVGYPPHSPESWNQLRKELAEAKSTVKKLWTTITELRKKGSRISDMEKSVLDRLVEQRNLYLEKQGSLAAELSILDKMLEKKSSGRIQCEKLYPNLDVQIGRFTQEITTAEENCNIHVADNRIFLR